MTDQPAEAGAISSFAGMGTGSVPSAAPDPMQVLDTTLQNHMAEAEIAANAPLAVALAKAGRPFAGFMVVEDGSKQPVPEFKAALREQQRVDLERSLEYAKKSLGAGARWRS